MRQHKCSVFTYLAPKSCRNPSLQSLHWLTIKERIHYKILSLTYKVLTTTEPSYLYHFISLQPHRNTRSSDVVSLARPPSCSSLKVNHCSFHHASPRLWNELPKEQFANLSMMSPCHCHLILLSHLFIIVIIITTFTMHHSISVPLQTRNLPFP